MPLQNRVNPFGDLIVSTARGELMGNRGGKFHTASRTLTARRWASRQWICCRLGFKGRHRNVWGASYTELFFLDEPTALAAGHRPCFECRRADAEAFAEAWRKAHELRLRPSAGAMDEVLHAERLDGRAKRMHRQTIDELPEGTFIATGEGAFALRGDRLLRWSPGGYSESAPRPNGVVVDVLTPPSIVAVLSAGYRPHWHASGEDLTWSRVACSQAPRLA